MANQFQCFVLTIMSSKDVIMIILENMYIEVTSRQYIDSVVKKKKTIWIYRLLAICRGVFCNNQITRESQKDVSIQSVQIHDCNCAKRRKKKDSSLYRDCKLFLSEDRFEIVRIDCGITNISPFRINVPLFSKSIQFGTKITRMEPDNKVELKKVLRPPCLPLD